MPPDIVPPLIPSRVPPRALLQRRVGRVAALTLAALFAGRAHAGDAIHQFGPSGGAALDFSVASGAARYEFTTGDSLVAHLNAGGSIGGIAGSRNAVVIPEFLFFPEVRADTRSGLKLSDEVVLDGAYELNLATSTSGVRQKGGHFHADGTFHADDH